MKKTYVVYAHYKKHTNDVFYVGIGKNKRRAYSDRSRNPHWHNTTSKYGRYVVILAHSLSVDEAKDLEMYLIKRIGRRDLGTGPLVNLTDGGDGAQGCTWNIGRKHSKSHGEKISKALTGMLKTEEHKEKLRVPKGDEYKKKLSESAIGRPGRHITEVLDTNTGITYRSITDAAKAFNMNRTTLDWQLRRPEKNKTSLIISKVG